MRVYTPCTASVQFTMLSGRLMVPIIFSLGSVTLANNVGDVVQLVGGLSRCSGRVEVYHLGIWGTVCEDNWKQSNADVVCRELGCGRALEIQGHAHYGAGSGPIWFEQVFCWGTEPSLANCSVRHRGRFDCSHDNDVGILCSLERITQDSVSSAPRWAVALAVMSGLLVLVIILILWRHKRRKLEMPHRNCEPNIYTTV